MSFLKHGMILFVSFLLPFLSACTTTSHETSDELLDTEINVARSTSSTVSSIILPTVTTVPQNMTLNDNLLSSSYLGSNIISEQDILSISVYKNSDLTRQVQVNDDGNIIFPLLSTIYVKGLSPTQLALKIKQGLEKDFIVKAHVNVLIKNTNKNQFT